MAAAREDTQDYARIFLSDTPLMDTRAPTEFSHGSFPTATSLPLMSDEERAAVGTCYKAQGQAAAIALGHQLVDGAVREERLAGWLRFAREHPDGYLYCFRGGLRSQIVQQWLADAGVAYPRIGGGYKAMRRFLLETLEDRAEHAEFLLVAGATGSGKTRAIAAIDRAVDLEGLAGHRGSAFGRLLDEQPSQIDFENALAIALLKLSQQPGPVFLEDEGRLIGRIGLPEVLRKRMEAAALLVIDEPLPARVQVLFEDYVLDLGARYLQRFGETGRQQHRDRLLGDLARIKKRLGGEREDRVAKLMGKAFAQPDDASAQELHCDWIRLLLEEYYDPMYEYQMAQRRGLRLYRGTRDAVIEYARGQVARG